MSGKSGCIYHFPIDLETNGRPFSVQNQSENGKYNLISVLNSINTNVCRNTLHSRYAVYRTHGGSNKIGIKSLNTSSDLVFAVQRIGFVSFNI